MTDSDDADDADDGATERGPAVSRVADRLRYLRYTLSPTLFVDEDSGVDDLLWQLVLEQRAARHWLAILTIVVVVVVAMSVAVPVAALLLS